MTPRAIIDLADGVTLELDLADTDRSLRDAALEYKRRHGCTDCGHAKAAHRTGNCSVTVDRLGGGSGKCGCASQKRMAAA